MRRIFTALALALSILLPSAAHAQSARLKSDPDDVALCIETAARSFNIPELPLWIILDVERGTLGKVSMNTNGTYDIGPMQINSIWLKRIAPYGITEHAVKNNLCMNVYVGAWIFTKELREHGTLTKAIAHYHSPTPKHQMRYLGLIQRALERRMARIRPEQALASNG